MRCGRKYAGYDKGKRVEADRTVCRAGIPQSGVPAAFQYGGRADRRLAVRLDSFNVKQLYVFRDMKLVNFFVLLPFCSHLKCCQSFFNIFISNRISWLNLMALLYLERVLLIPFNEIRRDGPPAAPMTFLFLYTAKPPAFKPGQQGALTEEGTNGHSSITSLKSQFALIPATTPPIV